MVEPIAHTLHKLFNKFGADERLNYDVIEKAMSRSHSRAATIVIAASDASDYMKEGADLVCDGSEDEEQFIEADAKLSDVSFNPRQGGKILASEGDFNFTTAAPFTNDIGRARHLQGMGWGTRFNCASGGFVETGNQSLIISDLLISNADIAIALGIADFGVTIRDVHFDSCDQAIDFTSDATNVTLYWLKLLNCVFTGCGGSEPVVDLRTATNFINKALIEGNTFDNGNVVDIETSSDDGASNYLALVGNHFLGDVKIKDYNYVSLSSNVASDGTSDLFAENIFALAMAANIFASYTETTCTSVVKSANIGTGF
jgi:hypothetical protein